MLAIALPTQNNRDKSVLCTIGSYPRCYLQHATASRFISKHRINAFSEEYALSPEIKLGVIGLE